MTDSGYNQILVIIDHFTNLAEAVPCQTASAEETCDHLITHWISRYGCPMTFQSDNVKAFVGDLTKELMKRSHTAQAHSTTYHPQTNGLQNVGEHAEGILLEIFDRLGKISAASGRGVQQHATLDNRNQSLHDVNGQGKEQCL